MRTEVGLPISCPPTLALQHILLGLLMPAVQHAPRTSQSGSRESDFLQKRSCRHTAGLIVPNLESVQFYGARPSDRIFLIRQSGTHHAYNRPALRTSGGLAHISVLSGELLGS